MKKIIEQVEVNPVVEEIQKWDKLRMDTFLSYGAAVYNKRDDDADFYKAMLDDIINKLNSLYNFTQF